MSECDNCCDSACDGNSCQDDKYLLTRVKHIKADTDPCTASESKNCDITEPRYDVLEQDYTLTGVGATGPLYVCNPAIYAVGQWLRLSGGTKVQITGVGADSITVRNSCADGMSAIEANSDPGTVFQTGQQLWITDPPACGDVDYCEDLLACIKNSKGICFSSVPDADPAEKLHLFGGTLLNDPCQDEQGDGLTGACLRKLKRIFSFNGALCYPDIPEINGLQENGQQKQFGVFRTGDGCGDGNENCFEKLEIGTDGLYRVCDGDIKFIEDARVPILVEREEVLHETYSKGNRNIDITLPNFPDDCGNGICVQVECQVYAVTQVSANLFRYQFSINGQEIVYVVGNDQFGVEYVPFPGSGNGTTVVCGLTEPNIELNMEEIYTNNDGAISFEVWVWVSLYYV